MAIANKQKRESKFARRHYSTAAKVFLILVLIIGVSFFVGSVRVVTATYGNYFTDGIGEHISDESFMDPNAERLDEYAAKFEQIVDLYHIPENLTGDGWDYYLPIDVNFADHAVYGNIHNAADYLLYADPLDLDDPANQIQSFGDPGHVAVYSGVSAIGDAFRYAVKKRDGEDLTNVTRRLYKLACAMNLMSDVTDDGGMVRWAIPDTPEAREYFGDGYFNENKQGVHLKYSTDYVGPNGKHYDFWCQTGTSMDCYLGVFNGLGMINALCDNATIKEITQEAIDRMLQYFVNNGWRFIDRDGKTHSMGSEALTGSPIIDTGYALNFLRIGKTANLERWGDLYDQYAYDRLLSKKIGRHAQIGSLKLFAWQGGYFNINLAYSIAGPLCFMETDPVLKNYYQEHWLRELHDVSKYHRNAWFDVMYYLGMSDADWSSSTSVMAVPDCSSIDEEWKELNEKSVSDSLLRLTYTKYPFRKFDWPYNFDSYSQKSTLDPIPDAPYPDLELYPWEEKVDTSNPIIKLAVDLFPFETVWDQPKPSDWRNTDPWIWEGSCFREIYVYARDVRAQSTPGSYTAPYWAARYLNYSTIAL